jgi:predicted molibdopterin-dependent oxidoreductase YjgC
MTQIRVTLNGESITSREGQSVGALLLEHEQLATRTTRQNARPRGMFCGIGICFDCLITINGITNQRACVTNIEEGMTIQTQQGSGAIA